MVDDNCYHSVYCNTRTRRIFRRVRCTRHLKGGSPMGLHKGYNPLKGKWYLSGFRFIRYYDTEEEMVADKGNAFEEYTKSLQAFRLVSEMLLQFRQEVAMQTVNEWLLANNFYEQAILLDINGKPQTDWVENDPKYEANVLRVEPKYPSKPWVCAVLCTDYDGE